MDRIQERLRAEVRAVHRYFKGKPAYNYERVLGQGEYGIACLIQENDKTHVLRKFVVKRAIGAHCVGTVETEVEVLTWLMGALHIVQGVIPPKTKDIETHLTGPTLITEYLHNGSLVRFMEGLTMNKRKVPNRLLWRIFLCCRYDQDLRSYGELIFITSDKGLYSSGIPTSMAR